MWNFVENVVAHGPFGNDKEKLREALEAVIKKFIQEDKLKEFLEEHGDEVIEMETLDFTFERREELIKKRYYEDGISQGVNNTLDILREVKTGEISLERAAEELNIRPEELNQLL